MKFSKFISLHLCGMLLVFFMSGCAKSDQSKIDKVSSTCSDDTPLWDGVRTTYKSGDSKLARKQAESLMDNWLSSVKNGKNWETKIGALGAFAATASAVLEGEKELSKTQPEESRKFMADCVKKLKQANMVLAKDIADAHLSDSDKKSLDNENKDYAQVVKNWILLNPCEKREELCKDNKEILESQGIKAADLVDASSDIRPPTPDQLLIENAKKDTEQIKTLIGSYYKELFAENAKNLRPIISQKITDEQIAQIISKWQEEKKQHQVEKIVSVEMTKSSIDVVSASNDRVSVHIKGVVVTVSSNGKEIVVDRDSGFQLLKENERWVLWFK
jgi:hypothetical protein